jgi:Domain of unknown function (DUF6457)
MAGVNVLDEWLAEVASVLDLDAATVVGVRDLVLDLTRDVAHGVARPAAPLTAFLVGLAAGRSGGGEVEIRAAVGAIDLLVAARPSAPGTAG